MRCSKVEVTFLAGIGMFLVGTACLIAVEVHSVFPAREEQKFKEINCTVASGNMDAKAKCLHNKHNGNTYPCLRVYVLCGGEANSDGLSQSKEPRLLSKDFHNLDQQCTYEPEKCMNQNEAKPHLLQSFQRGNPIGAPIQCYYNPKDPNQIVRHKTSKEDYNKLVLTSMAWSLSIVVLGIVIIVTAGCVVSYSRSREGYERIADQNSNVPHLQHTL